MPVLMLFAAVVILAGVVVVASGRGGEMVTTEPDYPPIDLGPVSAADVALLRPPSAAWGYNMRVTDEALETIAKAVTDRDVQIAALQQEVSDLRDQLGGGGRIATLDPPADDGPADDGGTEHTEPETSHRDWVGEAARPATAVPATRPEPIYQPDDHGDAQAEPPTQASAPWEPAERPEHEPLWEPPHQLEASPAITWEAPEPASDPAGPAGPAGPAAPAPGPAASWDPADTSPDVIAPTSVPTSVPVTPAQGLPQAPAPRDDQHRHFDWDEDPHEQVVWGAAHAQAKAEKATEETLPSTEPPDRDRD